MEIYKKPDDHVYRMAVSIFSLDLIYMIKHVIYCM